MPIIDNAEIFGNNIPAYMPRYEYKRSNLRTGEHVSPMIPDGNGDYYCVVETYAGPRLESRQRISLHGSSDASEQEYLAYQHLAYHWPHTRCGKDDPCHRTRPLCDASTVSNPEWPVPENHVS
jgi:hypothetical protein